MPARSDRKPEKRTGDTSVQAGRAATQMGWYRFAARSIVPGCTVLDAGCGLGHGIAELRTSAADVVGQDLDSRLQGDGTIIGPIEEVPAKSYDIVVSVDVIEHVADDEAFVDELTRIARKAVFLTTPLAAYGRPLWPYHIREYRAQELLRLVRRFGEVTYFKGTPSGSEIFEVRSMACFRIVDALVNSPLSNRPFRAAQKLLPRRLRYNAHQAVLVRVGR